MVKNRYVDRGEAIGLALQQHSDLLLAEDAEARQFAESLDLEVHDSIGLLLWNIASGFVEDQAQAYQILIS
jgi:predicted nucleic acid-binding protein